MSLSVKHGKIARVEKLTVERDLSGGVRMTVGGKPVQLSPEQAVGLAKGLLQAAGVTVEFLNRAKALAS